MPYLCGDIQYRSRSFEYETCMLTTTNTIEAVRVRNNDRSSAVDMMA